MKGLTTYAETFSVYGMERAFTDGETPWSKAFLAAAYAPRWVKVRFTSGTGSEALKGHAERCSMLYLEAGCLVVTKGAGSGRAERLDPMIALWNRGREASSGARRDLLASRLGLEPASGNDALASNSTMRSRPS